MCICNICNGKSSFSLLFCAFNTILTLLLNETYWLRMLSWLPLHSFYKKLSCNAGRQFVKILGHFANRSCLRVSCISNAGSERVLSSVKRTAPKLLSKISKQVGNIIRAHNYFPTVDINCTVSKQFE